MCFDILNRYHECDRQTDGRTEPPLTTARSTTRAKNNMTSCVWALVQGIRDFPWTFPGTFPPEYHYLKV